MNNDWKDALSSLRGNFDEPEESSVNEPKETKDSEIRQPPLTVVTDKKGRNGKIATIIEGFSISQDEVEEIARKLKQKLGVGGSVRTGEILIQGNHKESVVKFLQSLGFKTK